MNRVVERKSERIEFDIEIDSPEDVLATIPKQKEKRIYRTTTRRFQYMQLLSGLLVTVVLPAIVVITIPGMVILVLIAEVYLLDWTYSIASNLRRTEPTLISESSWRDPQDEIDRGITRKNPKDQFLK